jgi:hypothetical protein
MVNKGASMSQKITMLNNVDNELVKRFKDKSIKHNIFTKLEFKINIAGTDFTDIEQAIIHAYRCGLANNDQPKRSKENTSTVDQDELYRIIKNSQSMEHKADFLREIAKEWFPIDLHSDEKQSEKQIKTVHIELNELADFLEKSIAAKGEEL